MSQSEIIFLLSSVLGLCTSFVLAWMAIQNSIDKKIHSFSESIKESYVQYREFSELKQNIGSILTQLEHIDEAIKKLERRNS